MAIGPWQILVVALLLVLLFGATRIAGIGKGLGEGIRNFKKGLNDEPDEKKGSLEEGKKE
jgi:sec-independent protein translocase protein TatA